RRGAMSACRPTAVIPGRRSRRMSDSPSVNPMVNPQAKDGRAPDPLHRKGWLPMRCWRDEDEVDFAIVGTGAGGGTLACKLAEYGFSVIGFDAGPFGRPLEDFASDEKSQEKLFWLGPRITGGDNPVQLGS